MIHTLAALVHMYNTIKKGYQVYIELLFFWIVCFYFSFISSQIANAIFSFKWMKNYYIYDK